MPESTEAQIARLDERLKSIILLMGDASESQHRQQEWMTTVNQTLVAIGTRVESVEHSLAKASPTIDEFITIKHKIQGAGAVGKWLWVALGFLVGTAYSMRETLLHWISK